MTSKGSSALNDPSRRRRAPKVRTLASLQREVKTLLGSQYGVKPKRATQLVDKWHRFVRLRWAQGKAACSVADHIAKYEREHVVLPRRDCSGRPLPHRRAARDAENPYVGEVFESKAGTRWRIVDVAPNGKVTVERAGNRVEGKLVWGKSVLRTMKDVHGGTAAVAKAIHAERASGREPAPTIPVSDLIGRFFGVSEPANRDPDRRRRRKAKAAKARSKKRAAPKTRSRRALQVQTLIFHKHEWTKPQALAWARSHGFKASKIESKPNTWRIQQVDPKRMKIVSTKRLGKHGIFAVMGRMR
jgi:hypothetical protein